MTAHLRQPLRSKLQARWSSLLDWVYQPIISRLTNDEYFSCSTRGACVRTYLRRRFA